MLMSGMPEAAAILSRARDERLPAVVYGDYDVDGICACSLLTLALRRFGVDAAPHIPLREEGYGLNVEAVRKLAQTYRVLVTVDLGITNHEEVRLAQSLGMTVIVTVPEDEMEETEMEETEATDAETPEVAAEE